MSCALSDEITAFSNMVIAIGVFGVFWQVWLTKKLHRFDFEDALNKEYREIMRYLPMGAKLAKTIASEEFSKSMDYFMSYFDLTNEEIHFRKVGRVSTVTWVYWNDGIRQNLQFPAFRTAWELIKKDCAETFHELRKLEASNFKDDPKSW
jgi:hypothetical protein